MSAFSQIMNDRSEARRIYNQRKRIKQLEENNQAMQEEMARTWKIADEYKTKCEKAYKVVEQYNLGKYDYSIPTSGIIELEEILNG